MLRRPHPFSPLAACERWLFVDTGRGAWLFHSLPLLSFVSALHFHTNRRIARCLPLLIACSVASVSAEGGQAGAAAASVASALASAAALLQRAAAGQLPLVLPGLRIRLDAAKFAFVPGHTTTGFVVVDATEPVFDGSRRRVAESKTEAEGAHEDDRATATPQRLGWLVVHATV